MGIVEFLKELPWTKRVRGYCRLIIEIPSLCLRYPAEEQIYNHPLWLINREQIIFCIVLKIEARFSCMLGKNSTTKLAQEDLNLVILLSLQSSLDYNHLPQSMNKKTIFERKAS